MEIIKSSEYFVKTIKYYYYPESFSGSFRGLRYRLGQNWTPEIDLFDEKNAEYLEKTVLVVSVWPEPFCYSYTKKNNPEVIDTMEFDFTDKGLEQARLWICSKYDERRKEFESAMRQ